MSGSIKTNEPKTHLVARKLQGGLPVPPPPPSQEPRQRALMGGALFLLLLALSIVLWRGRDFWFPYTSEADSNSPAQPESVARALQSPTSRETDNASKAPGRENDKHGLNRNGLKRNAVKRNAVKPNESKRGVSSAAQPPATEEPSPPGATVGARTVLPPLEVEVVAGNTHRTLRPGNNSVRVELQPQAAPVDDGGPIRDSGTAANITSPAAERVQMSASTSETVASSVRPNYPLLARRMKVQGSVILQVLIGKDGVIQDLRVVSGPRILASAAQDAVRQWHFKPHYDGEDAVETQAKITVNFTISTN